MFWITSDHHFGHTNIIEYCDRPFQDVDYMNQYMIDKWNSVVRPGDKVFHLGDFSLGMDKEAVTDLVSKLNGDILLVRGNHDRFGKQKFIDCGFVDVVNKIEFEDFILTHRPLNENELDTVGKVNIHGHIHNNNHGHDPNKYTNVSVEMWDYTPIDFIELCIKLNFK